MLEGKGTLPTPNTMPPSFPAFREAKPIAEIAEVEGFGGSSVCRITIVTSTHGLISSNPLPHMICIHVGDGDRNLNFIFEIEEGRASTKR